VKESIYWNHAKHDGAKQRPNPTNFSLVANRNQMSYGLNSKGEYYRYQGMGSDVHWQKVENPQSVPMPIRRELGGPLR
jgi:hypothetical protein